MVARHNVMVLHGLTTKFVPFIWLLSVFLFVSPWTRPIIPINPVSFWTGFPIFLAGMVFIYEAIYAIPQNRNQSAPLVSAIFIMIIGIVNLVISSWIWVGGYNPLLDPDTTLVSLLLGTDLVFLAISTLWEVFMTRHVLAKKTLVHSIIS